MTKKFKKGDHVVYTTVGKLRVRGIVLKAHRFGRCTIEPRFYLKDDGSDCPGYIGGLAVIHAGDLKPLAPSSE